MVAATLRPVENPPRRDVVTFQRPAGPEAPGAVDAPSTPAADNRDVATLQLRAPEVTAATAAPAAALAPARPATAAKTVAVEPLDADSVRLHVTLSREAFAKLEAARDALFHARPGASLGEIVEAALDVLLREHAKRKGLVEIDHVESWALGGPTTIENTRLACRPHNQLAARRVFGGAWMDRFARRHERAPPGGPPAT